MSSEATPFRAGHPQGIAPRAVTAGATFSGEHVLLADVSEFQPDVADRAYLAWSKAIVIRAAYGDAHDDKAWYGGARRDALHAGGAQFVGIYQFLAAGQDGAAQARALHGLTGALRKGEVLVADFEQGSHAMLTAWYNEMLALGYPAQFLWTYAGLYFGQSAGALPVQWLADYTSSEPASPHRLWQFTDSYPVPGVGRCDCSVFHGSTAQLAALAYGGTASPAPAHAAATPAPGNLRESAESVGSAVTFTWDPVAGQGSYHFQLEWWKGGFGWVLSSDVQVPGGPHVMALAPRTRYRWRVAAGKSGYIWPEWAEFTTP